MLVAMIGSRNSYNLTVDDIIGYIPTGCTGIISGGAAGVDHLAEQAATRCGIPFRKILPDYPKYGTNAPLLRNKEIARAADCLFAFWDYSSKGTAATIAACIEYGTPAEVIGLPFIPATTGKR